MSLNVGLVLGVIILPTDVIISTSILNQMKIQKYIICSLEVESLFNDAVSIVLYKVALLFVFINLIDLLQAGENILVVGLGHSCWTFVFLFHKINCKKI
ncbi:cation:proton antiporter [Candidatus Coxiella mudrowiae]|uniref:cation:proton antiporter domain-containing protein n=1 Tax=Candidatus Coxiella mudrowiae TaxID=2054173 RepID=UPI001FD34E3D|nr:cation:proton antiporter [Candidatus Coxiella mudrowiae]